MHPPGTITGKPFFYDSVLDGALDALDEAVGASWARNELSPQLLLEMYQQAKIDELFHSNKIEGNSLTFGETVDVVHANKEIRVKPFKDQQEARNLYRVLDYVYRVGGDHSVTVTQNELRRIHSLLLEGIQADAGTYRTTQTVITGSKFSPPEAFEVPRHMTQLSDFLKHATDPNQEQDYSPIFGAAAAHVWLAQIHPFTDGNGRTSRGLMNLILMRRGYPPCIITEEDRPRYMDALESSWENGDLTLLMELIYENVNEHRKDRNWLRFVQARLEKDVSIDMEREYLVWRNAMTHLKSQFRLTVDNLNAMNLRERMQLRFIDYGELGLVKYDAMRSGIPANKTKCFGIELFDQAKRQLYVFFYDVAHEDLRKRAEVALLVTKNPSVSNLAPEYMATTADSANFQIGFDLRARKYVGGFTLYGLGEMDPPELARHFFDELLPTGSRA